MTNDFSHISTRNICLKVSDFMITILSEQLLGHKAIVFLGCIHNTVFIAIYLYHFVSTFHTKYIHPKTSNTSVKIPENNPLYFLGNHTVT